MTQFAVSIKINIDWCICCVDGIRIDDVGAEIHKYSDTNIEGAIVVYWYTDEAIPLQSDQSSMRSKPCVGTDEEAGGR